MCLGRLFKDIQTAIKNPPKGALDREILHARLRSYWVRIQYIAWNILATLLLYTFGDSVLNIYIYKKQYYYSIIFHSFQLLSIIAYFITSFRNPGFIEPMLDNKKHIVNIKMKESDNEEIYKYLDINIDEDDKISNYPYDIVNIVPDYNQEIRIDPDAAPSNFCWRCKFIRPIRSKHCYDCDRCVIKFDHHCPLVGNCVASNNHRYFVLFMSTQTIVVLWSFYISFNTLFEMNLIEYKNDYKNELIKRNAFGWFCRILFFIALFFAVFVTVGLSGYHIYLGFTNQTTYEMIKPQIVENYIKDETKRKKKYLKKQLKKDKVKEIKREKDLKKKHNELEKQIQDLLQNDMENKDDIKYDDNMSSISSNDDDDDMSSDFSVPEKVLLFHDQQKKRQLKRKETPKRNDFSRFTNQYRNYFDEGFIGNMMIFFTGKVYPEWETPLPCIVVTKSKKK